jgi:hypothetical protein
MNKDQKNSLIWLHEDEGGAYIPLSLIKTINSFDMTMEQFDEFKTALDKVGFFDSANDDAVAVHGE